MDWRWTAWQLYGGEMWRQVAACYDWLQESQWAAPDKLAQQQEEALERILRYALEASPYYKQLGLPPRLETFPILTRSLLREHADALLAQPQPPGRPTEWHTGGSTGEPVHLLCDEAGQALRRAALLRGDLWGTSLRPTDAWAGLWASNRDSGKVRSLRSRAYDWLWNRYIFSCFEMDEARALELNAQFQRLRPGLFYGPTTALQAFMHFGQRAGLPPWRFAKILPCGEQCDAQLTAELEAYFGAFTVDRYASNELGPMGSRCEQRTWHWHSENLLLEVLLPDGSISRSGRGSLLCTSLVNRAMPLIRYEIGDLVDLTPVACCCGRGLQTFTSLEGRVTEQLRCPDGRWLNLATFNQVLQGLPLTKYRLVIEDEARITFLLQSDEHIAPAVLEPLAARITEQIGGMFEYEFRQVPHIPTLPSGKNPYVVRSSSKA